MPNRTRVDRLAVASLVFAIVTVVLFYPLFLLVPITSVTATALGYRALQRIRASGAGGRAVALVGTGLGVGLTAVWLVLVVVFLIVY